MEQALDASESCEMSEYGRKWVWQDTAHPTAMGNVREAITALRQCLEQQPAVSDEPVAWGVDWGKEGEVPCVSITKRLPNGVIEVVAVKYGPQTIVERAADAAKQREWVGLTDDEITALKRNGERYISSQDFARAIEAKLKGKNT